MLQDGIMQRLNLIQDNKLRKEIHEMCCIIIPKHFTDKNLIKSFDFKKESVHGLALSQYIEDATLTQEHHARVREAARYFLRRMPQLMPSDVLPNPTHLLFFMRQDYVEQFEF